MNVLYLESRIICTQHSFRLYLPFLYLDVALLGNLTRGALVLDLIIDGCRVQLFRHVGGESDVGQVDEAGHGVEDDGAVNPCMVARLL